ncbi:sirohydrochlorin chelatase [Paenibacillus koleovorans]|uniref:sirohydrochlorin chelatase n=1 Tax=Paenibacillus koleovorans TaxID=121608 RepID=UPI000FD91B7E|nr:CbiX/SirB N-terminal domain-containing protein [Paenibacillus koleovorans]
MERKVGVLVISHGSRSDLWVRLVDEAVAAAEVPAGVPVVSSFLEIVEGRLIQDGIDALERQGVTDLVVVPLFVSAGSTHVDEIRGAFGVGQGQVQEHGLGPFRVEARVHFGEPLDEEPELAARILLDQLAAVSSDPAKERVLLVGHGSAEDGFYRKWREGLDRVAERLQAIGGFAQVAGTMLLPNEAPGVMEQLLERGKASADEVVLVAPFFLSEGYFTEKVIPGRLAGYTYRYSGRAMLPHPLVSRWVERQVVGRISGFGERVN